MSAPTSARMTSAVRWLIPGMVSSRRNGSAHGAICRAFAASTWLPEDRDPADPRNGLLELSRTLTEQLRGESGQPRDIAAGSWAWSSRKPGPIPRLPLHADIDSH
jgi:hypothetical protein